MNRLLLPVGLLATLSLGGLPACQGVNTTQREVPAGRPDIVADRRVELDVVE